jgi:hypothetical protein
MGIHCYVSGLFIYNGTRMRTCFFLEDEMRYTLLVGWRYDTTHKRILCLYMHIATISSLMDFDRSSPLTDCDSI